MSIFNPPHLPYLIVLRLHDLLNAIHLLLQSIHIPLRFDRVLLRFHRTAKDQLGYKIDTRWLTFARRVPRSSHSTSPLRASSRRVPYATRPIVVAGHRVASIQRS